MSTNYLAVVSCGHCGEMIITKPDGTIFCDCTTERSCKHPEGMGDCHECAIGNLERQLAEAQGKLKRISRQADASVAILFRDAPTAGLRREQARELHSGLKDIGDTARAILGEKGA